jgi:hypothetical protein
MKRVAVSIEARDMFVVVKIARRGYPRTAHAR